jgi:broad specificity phosphatase PhoE
MADIYFIRHGQASFGKEDYDELSDLGHEQAKIVGRNLALICKPAVFVSGSLKRQKQTLENVLQGFDESLVADVAVKTLDAFNEFDHENVLNVVYPEFIDRSKMMAELSKQPEPKKYFHKLYRKAVKQWVLAEGEFSESFKQFEDRVESGFLQLMDQAKKGETIVVVSSAGPIAMCMKQAMGLSVEKAFALNEIMANTGVSRVIFNQTGEVNLSFFNSYQHLPLNNINVTYR